AGVCHGPDPVIRCDRLADPSEQSKGREIVSLLLFGSPSHEGADGWGRCVEYCRAVTFGDVFFFKQKTAYEIHSYWSSDVCSSDLLQIVFVLGAGARNLRRSLIQLRLAQLDNGA